MGEQDRLYTDAAFESPPSEHDLQHHTELPETALSRVLDAFIGVLGRFFSWFWLATVAIILVSVIMRYAFGQGSILLEELSWHLFGFAWTVGLAYTLVSDDHVRVDVLHERMPLKAQAWIEIIGLLALLLPFLVLVIYYSVPYVYDSFARGEASQAPSGLPYRFVLKSMIPVSMGLLIIAVVARLSRCTALLFGFPGPLRRGGDASQHSH